MAKIGPSFLFIVCALLSHIAIPAYASEILSDEQRFHDTLLVMENSVNAPMSLTAATQSVGYDGAQYNGAHCVATKERECTSATTTSSYDEQEDLQTGVVFVINMKKRTDRRRNMEERLTRAGVYPSSPTSHMWQSVEFIEVLKSTFPF